VVGLALATAAALAALVGAVAGRGAVGLSAVTAPAFTARRTADGRAANGFEVALENHGRRAVVVALAARAKGGPHARFALRPAEVTLAPGERRQLRVVALSSGLPAGRTAGELVGEARDGGRVLDRRAAAVSFVVPEGP
jgi:P pilus assembly chaperone PapD